MNHTHGSPQVRRLRRVAAPVAALAIALAACGSDDEASDTPAVESEADSDDGASVQQTSTITVDGDPLIPLPREGDDPSTGATAPLVSGEAFDGTPMSIGGPTDTATMVVFLAHWCPHCNDEIPELLELEESGSLPDDLEIVAVSTAVDDTRDNYPPSEWLDEKGWAWDAMADDEAGTAITAFGGSAFPFTTILDSDGSVLGRRAGSAPAEVILDFIEDSLR